MKDIRSIFKVYCVRRVQRIFSLTYPFIALALVALVLAYHVPENKGNKLE